MTHRGWARETRIEASVNLLTKLRESARVVEVIPAAVSTGDAHRIFSAVRLRAIDADDQTSTRSHIRHRGVATQGEVPQGGIRRRSWTVVLKIGAKGQARTVER